MLKHCIRSTVIDLIPPPTQTVGDAVPKGLTFCQQKEAAQETLVKDSMRIRRGVRGCWKKMNIFLYNTWNICVNHIQNNTAKYDLNEQVISRLRGNSYMEKRANMFIFAVLDTFKSGSFRQCLTIWWIAVIDGCFFPAYLVADKYLTVATLTDYSSNAVSSNLYAGMMCCWCVDHLSHYDVLCRSALK